MKFMDELTTEKLRGAFYTPDLLVDICLAYIGSKIKPGGVVEFWNPRRAMGLSCVGWRSALHSGRSRMRT